MKQKVERKRRQQGRFFVSFLIEIKLKVKEGTQIIFKNKMSRNLNRTNMSNHSGFTIWKFNNTMLSRCNSSKKSDAMDYVICCSGIHNPSITCKILSNRNT